VLFDEARELLCRIACAWAGIELSEREVKRRTRELSAMVEGSGSVGPTAWWGLLMRARNERWAKGEVCPFAFVPQGGGDVRNGHRCPGEDVAVALTRIAAEMLAREMRYEVPAQDLRINLARIPALPKSRFVMRDVRRAQPAAAPVHASAGAASPSQ
jgi:cytochrome P450